MASSFKRWFPAAVWLIIIFFLSNQPDLPSNKIDVINFLQKKSAHVFEYFVLTLLLFRAYRYHRLDLAIYFAVLYAFSDEAHQLFIFGRTGLIRDVAIDSLGIAIAAIFILKKQKWFPHTTPRIQNLLKK